MRPRVTSTTTTILLVRQPETTTVSQPNSATIDPCFSRSERAAFWYVDCLRDKYKIPTKHHPPSPASSPPCSTSSPRQGRGNDRTWPQGFSKDLSKQAPTQIQVAYTVGQERRRSGDEPMPSQLYSCDRDPVFSALLRPPLGQSVAWSGLMSSWPRLLRPHHQDQDLFTTASLGDLLLVGLLGIDTRCALSLRHLPVVASLLVTPAGLAGPRLS